MRNIVLLFIITTLLGCKNHQEKTAKLSKNIPAAIEPNIINGNDKDTVYITTDTTEIVKYSKVDLKKIIKACPELIEEIHDSPDDCFAKAKDAVIDMGRENNTIRFDCELCRDNYYSLYAYFLKMRDGGKKYKIQRETLIKLYRDINFIYRELAHGGTYYSHQYSRIAGYAEYSVYLFHEDENYGDLKKSYSIAKQKGFYIATLKQMIDDEVNNDSETLPKEKTEVKKDLLKTVTDINSLITDYFYLNMTQEFQYSHY